MTVENILFQAYENGGLLKNRYRKISNLQSGTYGQVSLATDTVTGDKVAIKAMDRAIDQVEDVANHEISILSKLEGVDNVCQLLDSFESKNHFFLVLEYCELGDLYDFLHSNDTQHEKPYENSFLFKNFALDLGTAIKQCHDLGIFHRDIKPENILVSKDLKFKLADWGLASTCRFSNEPEIGTDKYMAPECVFKDSTNSTYYDCLYADYWSFGITLLYTLFGNAPFIKCCETNDPFFRAFINKSKDRCSVNMNIFYDIYPNLSQTGFECIVQPLLQIAPQDRSLDDCLSSMETNYCYGLTVDEELELEEYNQQKLEPLSSPLFANENELLLNAVEENLDENNLFDHNTEEDYFNSSDDEFPAKLDSASPLEISADNLKRLNDLALGLSDTHFPSIPPSLIDSTPTTSILKLNEPNTSGSASKPISITTGIDIKSKDTTEAAKVPFKNSYIYGSNLTSEISWVDLDEFDDYEFIGSFEGLNLNVPSAKPFTPGTSDKFNKINTNRTPVSRPSKLSASITAGNKVDNWC